MKIQAKTTNLEGNSSLLPLNRSKLTGNMDHNLSAFLGKAGQLLLLVAAFGLFSPLFAQDQAENDPVMVRARAHAKALAAPEMVGRGYHDDGHLKAAAYIADGFKQAGLQPVPALSEEENPYFQTFRISLSIAQDPLSLTIGKKEMQIGKDFIMKSNSGRGELDEMKVCDLGWGMPQDFDKSLKGKIVLWRSGLPPKIAADPELKKQFARFQSDDLKIDFATKMQAEAVIIIKEKLTASLSMVATDLPIVEVLSSSLPRKKTKKAALNINNKFAGVNTQNVVGMIPGTKYPDSVVVVCGHYDHLGRQGDAIFYGGNDNASGTAMLLTMAEFYGKPENRPAYTMAFIAFGAEEVGLLGSRFYVEDQPLFPLEKTAFVLNMDLMANGDKGITAVAGRDFPAYWNLLKDINEQQKAVPIVKGRNNAPNSDHYFFVKKGVKAMFIYTLGGPPHYHDVNDTYEEMTFSKFLEVRGLLMGFLDQIMDR